MQNFNEQLDLKDHCTNFLTIKKRYGNAEQEKHTLSISIRNFQKDIELLQNNEETLTQQLKLLSEDSNFPSINKIYVNLKETYSELESKYCSLQREYSNLEQQLKIAKQRLEDQTVENNAISTELNDRIKALETCILQQQEESVKKQCELYNELQVAQAENNFQCGENEVIIQSLRTQLRNQNESYNKLNEQYLTYKTESTQHLESANLCIQDLERKLLISEHQLKISQNQLCDSKNGTNRINVVKNNLYDDIENPQVSNVFVSKPILKKYDYTENNLLKSIYHNNEALETNIKPILKAGKQTENEGKVEECKRNNQQKTVNVNRTCGNYKPTMPPLKTLSNTCASSNIPKKRKLYNPDSMEYFTNNS